MGGNTRQKQGNKSSSSGNGVKYTVKVAFSNRTATGVKATITWTQQITGSAYFGYTQSATVQIGNASTGKQTICSSSQWAKGFTNSKTVTKTFTLNITGLTATQTSAAWTITPAGSSCPSKSSGNVTIPAY